MTLNKKTIKRSFDKASASYDKHSFIQQIAGKRLIERLAPLKINPQVIVDLGAGTGLLTRQLQQKYPQSTVLGVDLAYQMMHFARKQQTWHLWKKNPYYIQGDMDNISLPNNSVDLIFSNFTLQWSTNIQATIDECKRILRPNGVLLFSTVGPQTLYELRESWQKVDNKVHVNSFMDMHDYGDLLYQSRFDIPVMDMELVKIEYPNIQAILTDLKATGACNLLEERSKGCTGKKPFLDMISHYETFKNANHSYPVTFEILYGLAWQKPLEQNCEIPTRIPLQVNSRALPC